MGRFVNNNLYQDEQVIFETNYHWICFFTLESLLTLGLYHWYRIYSTEFVVTNRRIIIKKGLISYNSHEMSILNVRVVDVRQSILGRILGYGSIIITGTGGIPEFFNKIRNPRQFRRSLMQN